MSERRIETLKAMHLTTDLRSETAEIVAPSGPGWRRPAERLRDLLRAATGQELRITAGETAALSALSDRHWVLLGSAMNNPALMALYRRKYAFVDDFYPGADGYVLQTIHNPEGRGHNLLLVGASSPAGAVAGLDRLEALFAERDGPLGYTSLARSTTHSLLVRGDPSRGILPADLTLESFRERTEAAFRGNAGRGPIEQGISLGLVHHFTHDPSCAQMFRDVLFYYEDLVRNRYDGTWCFEHMLFIYAWTWRLFYIWDLIEESDAFTDAERLRMTNLLWGLTNYVAGLTYFRGEEPPRREIRQNHPTFAALSMSFSAGYFRTYYGIDDFAKHLRFCQAIFDGQAACYKPNDDGGGGGYCWLVPNHQMIYDLKRDDFRFLENGSLRGIADYAILITDNLGSQVAFGDVGNYGARRRPSAGVTSTLCKAAWYYEDGGYLWALAWMGGTTPHHDCFYKELPQRVPDHMTGITVAPFNPPLYEWVERHGPGGANVPVTEAFDKLTLRGGFSPEDEYLLLDGTSTFAHGHEDGNSIERLTWKGRMWLAESDYIWKRPRHHSSLVSICDGESIGMPSLVALKWAEAFGDLAFTRTSVPAYNGVDWTRDVLWLKGMFLLVADSAALLRDADYDLRCLWRTLGAVDLHGELLDVEQQGVFFRIQNVDDSVKSLETEEPRTPGRDPYQEYEFAGGPIRIFRQRTTLRGRPGNVERFFNLMVAGTKADVEAYQATRVGEGWVRVEGPGSRLFFCVAGGDSTVGAIRTTAEGWALTEEDLVLLDGTRLAIGDIAVETDVPVHLRLSPAEGRAEVRSQQAVQIRTRGLEGLRIDGSVLSAADDVRLDAGPHHLAFQPFPREMLPSAIQSGRPYLHQRVPKESRFVPAGASGFRPVWETAAQGAIRCLESRGGRIAVGTAAGEVALLDLQGHVAWRQHTGAEVRTVHLAELGGAGRLLAGGRDCALTLFDDSGKTLWRREFAMSHGRDQIVNAIATADLTGDGATQIVVATDGWLVWALTPAGEELWQRQIEHHAAQSLVIADVEGDGRKEILVGTEYHNSNMLEADGRIRWTVRGGPCFTALALTDLNGDGIREALYGAMDGNVYAIDSVTGKTLWTANLGDDVRHGVVLATGFAAGSESGNVALLSPDGQKLWRRDLDAPVTGLARIDHGDDRDALIAAATAAGWIVLLTPGGEIVGSRQMESAVTVLQAVSLPEEPGLLVGTDGGRLTALALDRTG